MCGGGGGGDYSWVKHLTIILGMIVLRGEAGTGSCGGDGGAGVAEGIRAPSNTISNSCCVYRLYVKCVKRCEGEKYTMYLESIVVGAHPEEVAAPQTQHHPPANFKKR